ncbi:hypothetical protein GCM10009000_064870 [Halobacterium noricense]|uniref:Uncharacterized protein n=1 Tax=Haladaptatus pallidirubidus TaxID=1008152 RepID=A0AAV3UHZ4_9EURY
MYSLDHSFDNIFVLIISFAKLVDTEDHFDILSALKREDSSVGGSATDPRGQLAGSCALLWDCREGVVSPVDCA